MKKKQQEKCWKVMEFVVGKQKTNRFLSRRVLWVFLVSFHKGKNFLVTFIVVITSWIDISCEIFWNDNKKLCCIPAKSLWICYSLLLRKMLYVFCIFLVDFKVYLKFHNNHVLFHWNQQELWGFLHKKIFENMQYHKKSPIYILTKFFLCLSNLSFPFVYFVFL